MPLVVDASIAASWYFPDEENERSDTILDSLEDNTVLVPVLFWFEVRNLLIMGERRRRSTTRTAAEFLNWLARLPIQHANLPDSSRSLELARRHQLTFYDAAYLELAQRERLPLATLDKQLAAAARAEGISLIAS